MPDKRCVDDLTIEELEQILLMKKRQARLERLRRLSSRRAAPPHVLAEGDDWTEGPAPPPGPEPHVPVVAPQGKRVNLRWVRDTFLLIVEILALLGLLAVLGASLLNLHTLNQEVAQAREPAPTSTPTPLIQVRVLPGAHAPPGSIGSVPQRLADLVQPLVPVPIPTPGPQSPTRIVIPSIGVDAPVVEGDDWEQLKKGAGHHIGSANPGERGNCIISAHNDIFGEIFRDLERVELEDEVLVYAGDVVFRYIVKAKRIVEPDDVSVMAPTSTPVLTLITCHPYMIDTHRLVVIAELAP